MHLNKLIHSMTLLAFICLQTAYFVNSLRDVRVKIPHAVRRGEKAVLKCIYELDDQDVLYSVKWYKGRREFYSFTPKETPAMKVFQLMGVKVERALSNESQLVLDAVNLATTGKYSCEVSADAPSFHTLIGAGELEVVEVPGKDPFITGIRARYRPGDIVRGNCTSRHSKPAANLTWTINGYETNPSHIRLHRPINDSRGLETAQSGIHFVVTPQHFVYGKLKIRCTAHIHDVYWKSTENSIEEDRHRHHSGNNLNLINTFSDDYFDVEDGNQIDRSDTYMTHIKGDVSSLNANSGARAGTSSLPRLTALAVLLGALQHWLLQLCQQLFNYCATPSAAAAPAATTMRSAVNCCGGRRRRSGNRKNTKGQHLSGPSVANAIRAQRTKRHEIQTKENGNNEHHAQRQQQQPEPEQPKQQQQREQQQQEQRHQLMLIKRNAQREEDEDGEAVENGKWKMQNFLAAFSETSTSQVAIAALS